MNIPLFKQLLCGNKFRDVIPKAALLVHQLYFWHLFIFQNSILIANELKMLSKIKITAVMYVYDKANILTKASVLSHTTNKDATKWFCFVLSFFLIWLYKQFSKSLPTIWKNTCIFIIHFVYGTDNIKGHPKQI